jgi:hypothetical protein
VTGVNWGWEVIMIIKIKVGRDEYSITEDDQFMDNGNCVQLLTQSKERSDWGRIPNPVLSKREVKNISKFKRVEIEHSYREGVSVFSLKA